MTERISDETDKCLVLQLVPGNGKLPYPEGTEHLLEADMDTLTISGLCNVCDTRYFKVEGKLDPTICGRTKTPIPQ